MPSIPLKFSKKFKFLFFIYLQCLLKLFHLLFISLLFFPLILTFFLFYPYFIFSRESLLFFSLILTFFLFYPYFIFSLLSLLFFSLILTFLYRLRKAYVSDYRLDLLGA